MDNNKRLEFEPIYDLMIALMVSVAESKNPTMTEIKGNVDGTLVQLWACVLDGNGKETSPISRCAELAAKYQKMVAIFSELYARNDTTQAQREILKKGVKEISELNIYGLTEKTKQILDNDRQ